MNKIILAAALAIASQSFAIVGFGGHYVMNTGSTSATKDSVYHLDGANADISLDRKGADGLGGFGLKLWIDALPFIDIEATGNMQFSRYSTSLVVTDSANNSVEIPIEMEFDNVPFLGKARPVFAAMSGDLSVTYPFTMLPIIRPYIGGGVSYIASTPVLDRDFATKFLQRTGGSIPTPEEIAQNPNAANALGDALGEALAKEGLNSGVAAHALVGLRIKPPVIPLAIYANGKYYLGGNFDSAFDPGFVFEIGGGFAI